MRLFVLTILMLCITGCATIGGQHTVVVNSTVPVIPVPEKPKLELLAGADLEAYKVLPESAKKVLQENDKALKIFSQQMSDTITVYNRYSQEHNAANQQWVNQSLGGKK